MAETPPNDNRRMDPYAGAAIGWRTGTWSVVSA
jgi:hypothetical protein